MPSRINGLKQSTSLSNIVVNHLNVVLKRVVLTEEDILFKPSLTQLIVADELTVSTFIMMSDELSLESRQNLFENISYIIF
jgi:hypothetical protein